MLIEEVPPWYSQVMLKLAYQNTMSETFWDIPICAEHNEVRANRIDARLVSHGRNEVWTLKLAAHGLRVEPRKMRKRHSRMDP